LNSSGVPQFSELFAAPAAGAADVVGDGMGAFGVFDCA
jgi:hypothetical protein